eukprot:7082160-Prymnesium_polylepis.1
MAAHSRPSTAPAATSRRLSRWSGAPRRTHSCGRCGVCGHAGSRGVTWGHMASALMWEVNHYPSAPPFLI